MDLEEAGRRARSGPLVLLGRRAVIIMITFLSTITVARLVPPSAFGLATMAAVLLAFGQIFRDFGLTNAVLRKGIITPEEMSFIFWINAVVTLALAGIIALLSPFAAAFYGHSVVAPIILVSLIGFILTGLAQQHRAMLNRELRFATLASADIGALLCGFGVTLVLAFRWHDVWAIVLGTLVQSAVASVLYIAVSGWTPGRFVRPAEMTTLLKFGANTSVFSMSTFLSGNAAAIVIGHFLGASQLGQYNRGQALFGLPSTNLIQPITQAAMPLLTRLRPYPEQYREAYLSMVRKLCAFLLPMSVALTISGPVLARVLLGPNWIQAGLVFAALSPAFLGIGVAYAIGDLFITQDRSAELRTVGLYEMVLRAGSVVLLVRFGVVATALGFTVSTLCAALLRVLIVGRRGPVTSKDQFLAAAPGVPMAMGAGLACVPVILAATFFSDLLLVLALLSLSFLGALLGGLLFPASRLALGELAEAFGIVRLARLVVRNHGS